MPFPRALFFALLAPLLPLATRADIPPRRPAAPLKKAATENATLHLTLTKAIRMAMEKNLAIKVDAFGPQIARARTTSEEGVFDPELQGDFTQEMVRNADGSEFRTGNFSTGLGGRTPLGTIYSLGLSSTSFDYRSYQTGAAVGLTQPLLRGFGTDVNLAGLRIARTNQQSSQWVFRQQVIDVVTQTLFVYNELYASLRNLDAAERSRDSARRLEEDEKRRVEIGVKIGLDVTTARAEAASREEAVLLAQSSIDDNERFLKQLITDDTATLLQTRVSIEPPPMPAVGRVDVEEGLREALLERPDYRQALLELEIRHINVVLTHNETLPRLDLTGSLNLLGVNRNEFGSSLTGLSDSDSSPNSWSAGVIFRLPIPNRAARGRHTAAKLLTAQALLDLHRMEQAIIVDVANAAGQITTARKRIDTTREALRLANESLDAGQERLKAGSATTFEVLELQEKLTQSEAAVIKAEGDYRNAVSEYDRKTGTTLARNAITIAP